MEYDEENSEIPEDEIEKAYTRLSEMRDLELNLFSQRTIAILVVQGALLALTANVFISREPEGFAFELVRAVLAVGALFISILCLQMMRGARYWVDYYERCLGKLEPKVLPHVGIFAAREGRTKPKDQKGFEDLKHVSVKAALQHMCVAFVVIWSVIVIAVVLG